MSKIKEKKPCKFSKRTMTLACIVAALAFFICAITIFIGLDGNRIFSNGTITVEEIQTKSNAIINEHEYALLVLDIQNTVADEGTSTYRYILSSKKDSDEHSYVYIDSDGTELYQYWDYDAENENYCIYIHDTDNDVWVKTSYDYEPITSDTWAMLTDLSKYDLMEETATWYNSDDECYVLEMLGQTEDFSAMYEQLYIRVSDFMPMGIVAYAVSDVNEDKMQNGVDLEINDDNIVSATEEIPTYNEYIQVYEVAFSNEDLKLFGVPDNYLTEEEYMELIGSSDEAETEGVE
jgi:hypothetical protein